MRQFKATLKDAKLNQKRTHKASLIYYLSLNYLKLASTNPGTVAHLLYTKRIT